VRRWIRSIAARRYEITIDRSTVKISQISDASLAMRHCNISDIREIRSAVIVSEGEGSHKHPEITRLEIVSVTGKPIEVLSGRPVEETQWVARRLKRALDDAATAP